MKNRTAALAWSAGSVLAFLAAGALAQSTAPAADKGASKPAAPALVAKPAPPEPRGAAVPGEESEVAALVLAGEETTLSSQMAGKVLRLHAGLGDAVKAGTKLVDFDCAEQQAQQQAAEAEYRGARETHLSRLRLQALGAAGELEVTLAAAAAEKARSQVVLRESQTAYCSVLAPFSGKIARMNVKVAESVPAGHALLDLVNPSSLRARLFVPAAWSAWVRTGSPLEVRFKETGRTYRARVSKLNARVDGVSQQLELEARFEATGGLLPGMVGTATFPARPAR